MWRERLSRCYCIRKGGCRKGTTHTARMFGRSHQTSVIVEIWYEDIADDEGKQEDDDAEQVALHETIIQQHNIGIVPKFWLASRPR